MHFFENLVITIEYQPTPLSEPNLRCTAHGPSLERLGQVHVYLYMHTARNIKTSSLQKIEVATFPSSLHPKLGIYSYTAEH